MNTALENMINPISTSSLRFCLRGVQPDENLFSLSIIIKVVPVFQAKSHPSFAHQHN